MTQNKIQPWHYSAEDQITDYAQKLTTLNNFNSSFNLKKMKIQRNIDEQFFKHRHDKILVTQSANVTLKNFNRTNRSQYMHRITKLVFDEENKKYKLQPETGQVKKRRLRTLKSKRNKQSFKQQHSDSKLETKKGQKQIYYNLTQISSVSKRIIPKCYTQHEQQITNTKMVNKTKQSKSNIKLPVFRQLSVERKIYIIQSGNKSTKNAQKQGLFQMKKRQKKKKNIIEEICRVQRQQFKQRNKICQKNI